MNKATTASINAVLPALRMAQPTQGDGYLIVARELLQALEPIASLSKVPPRAAALIAAHTLECILKTYLWHKGKSKEIRKRDIQHDLLKLWCMAYDSNLDIARTPPAWCKILGSGHGPLFYFRYQEGENKTIVHGGQTPEMVSTIRDLKALLRTVERSIRNTSPR